MDMGNRFLDGTPKSQEIQGNQKMGSTLRFKRDVQQRKQNRV